MNSKQSVMPPAATPAGEEVIITERVAYSLYNGEERHKRYPDAFPSTSRKRKLRVGQHGYLLFRMKYGNREFDERLIARVTHVEPDCYVGELYESSLFIRQIKKGMLVEFQADDLYALK